MDYINFKLISQYNNSSYIAYTNSAHEPAIITRTPARRPFIFSPSMKCDRITVTTMLSIEAGSATLTSILVIA